jgi:hypothetical protein
MRATVRINCNAQQDATGQQDWECMSAVALTLLLPA